MAKHRSGAGTLSGAREIDVREFAHAIMNGDSDTDDLDARALEFYNHYAMDEDELIRDVYPHLLIAAQFCQCRLPRQTEGDELLSIDLSEQDVSLVVSLLEEKGSETIQNMQHCKGSLRDALESKAERIEAALRRFN